MKEDLNDVNQIVKKIHKLDQDMKDFTTNIIKMKLGVKLHDFLMDIYRLKRYERKNFDSKLGDWCSG